MAWKTHYRLTLWATVLSALILAGTMAATSIRIISQGKRFTEVLLEENRSFLRNTLRFGHWMMMSRADARNYQSLIEMALRSRFIRYVALLDASGTILAQSDRPQSLVSMELPGAESLVDGGVVRECSGLLVIAYRAEEPPPDTASPEHDAGSMMASAQMLSAPAWYVVALDTATFRHHYHDMVIQTVGVGAAFFLLGVMAIVFLAIVQRYELAHSSLERLQKIKRVLGHFVPEFAKKVIEKDPERKGLLDKYLQDATVLFLDVEGFSLMVERYPQEQVNRTIETHFSRFFDLIQKHGGDINETAGDGIMVIFLDPDSRSHALRAAKAAVRMRRVAGELSAENAELLPIMVNIGMQSGRVYLGSTKLRGSGGERWTFTASGAVTVLAARLAQAARGGQILVGEETARRIDNRLPLRALGRLALKNVRDSGEVFEIADPREASG